MLSGYKCYGRHAVAPRNHKLFRGVACALEEVHGSLATIVGEVDCATYGDESEPETDEEEEKSDQELVDSDEEAQ